MIIDPKPSLLFLGTGTSQGVPVLACDCEVCTSTDGLDNRTRTSALFQVSGKNLVIDTGPDFRLQLLREKIKSIDAVLFTHAHKDHIAGFDDIRPFYFNSGKPMEVYASIEVEEALRREYPYVFVEDESKRYPGAPKVNLHTISNSSFQVDDVEVIPIKIGHGKFDIHAFRIGDITYITDANHIEPEEIDKIRGSKIIVLNALRTKPHHSHFTLQEALEVLEELQPEKAYLTHISHLLGKHEDVSKQLPDWAELAFDGLRVG